MNWLIVTSKARLDSDMAFYFLTWDAKQSELGWAQEQSELLARDGRVAFWWSCGNTKKIRRGDTAFFLRQRMEPRGVMGLGEVLDPPELREHWDLDRAKKGETALMIRVSWTCFDPTPVILRVQLNDPPYSEVNWNSRISGITIPTNVGEFLESDFLSRMRIFPDEIKDDPRFPEGAKRQVTVNGWERSSAARAACIEYHGTQCMVCGMDFAGVYGKVAEGFIHVHHLIPWAEIQKVYQVDPIKDLRPVCPNCHAVIHRRDPPFSIDEAKILWRGDTS